MAQKKIPARQCIGCMTSRPKKELVRVVRAPACKIGREQTVGLLVGVFCPQKIIIQKTQSPTESFHYSWTVQTGFREKKISLWDSASFVRKKELISQCNPRSF